MLSTDRGTYERLLTLISGLKRSDSADDRDVLWCEGGHVVGVARSPQGCIEIFLSGPELAPGSRLIRENLIHQEWIRRGTTDKILANRLLLPPAGHFDQVAAFVCTELLREGIIEDFEAAFHRAEPVIEIAIEQLRMADNTILGLVGELVFLEALLRVCQPHEMSEVLDSWVGYQPSARDFQVGPIGVEVKTTTRTSSIHEVQGVHQVEPGHGFDGVAETNLFLLSLGMQWLDTGAVGQTTSLPQVVDAILALLDRAVVDDEKGEDFARKVREYGSSSSLGYDHATMSTNPAFTRPLRTTFSRCYDMLDSGIQVLRSDDLVGKMHVDLDSVTFRVQLPLQIRGDMNPTNGLTVSARRVLELSRL